MRHSPERVADVACGMFGILRHELYSMRFGYSQRNAEALRQKQLVVSAVREIAGASFPDIARALGHTGSHSTEHSAYYRGTVSRQEILAFMSDVRHRLREFEPKEEQPKPDRDARCDGVWFSPACREPSDGPVTIADDEVRSADAASQPPPELPPALGEEVGGRGRVQGSRSGDRGQASPGRADVGSDDPPSLLD